VYTTLARSVARVSSYIRLRTAYSRYLARARNTDAQWSAYNIVFDLKSKKYFVETYYAIRASIEQRSCEMHSQHTHSVDVVRRRTDDVGWRQTKWEASHQWLFTTKSCRVRWHALSRKKRVQLSGSRYSSFFGEDSGGNSAVPKKTRVYPSGLRPAGKSGRCAGSCNIIAFVAGQ